MIRGTTPTHIFAIPFETNIISCVRIIYAQNDEVLFEKQTTDCTLTERTISTTLTQEETLLFDSKYLVQIQLRILLNDGSALASKVNYISLEKCLSNEVIV